MYLAIDDVMKSYLTHTCEIRKFVMAILHGKQGLLCDKRLSLYQTFPGDPEKGVFRKCRKRRTGFSLPDHNISFNEKKDHYQDCLLFSQWY